MAQWYFFLPQVFILLLAGLAAGFSALGAWRQRTTPGARLLLVGMLFIMEWCLASTLEAGAADANLKIFFHQAATLGFCATPGILLMFVLIYTRQVRQFGPLLLTGLWSIPTLSVLLAWTNGLHGLFWQGLMPDPGAFNVVLYLPGPWFWVNLAYLYILFTAIVLVLLREYIAASQAYRLQIGMMSIASIGPIIAGLLFIANIQLVRGMDWIPVGTAIAGMAYVLAFYRFRFLDLVPVAREALVEQMRDGVIVIDARQKIIDINAAARRLLGEPEKDWIGASFSGLLPGPNEHSAQEQSTSPTEFILTPNPLVWIELRYSFIFDYKSSPAGTVVVLRDITRRKKTELALMQANQRLKTQIDEINSLKDQLREQAIRDMLTGLFNRRYLEEMLVMVLARARRENQRVSLLMLDIDHFKRINDCCGHPNGDVILQRLGEFIRQKTRTEDIACRYGGEEFIIVMPGASAQVAAERAEGLRRGFSELRFQFDSQTITPTFSVGVAAFPDHGSDASALVLAADQALYRAKSLGRNRVEICQPTDPDSAS